MVAYRPSGTEDVVRVYAEAEKRVNNVFQLETNNYYFAASFKLLTGDLLIAEFVILKY